MCGYHELCVVSFLIFDLRRGRNGGGLPLETLLHVEDIIFSVCVEMMLLTPMSS